MTEDRSSVQFCYIFLPLFLFLDKANSVFCKLCVLNLAKVREPFHTEISSYFTDTQMRRVNTVQN